jgi:hypothetical protein
MILLGTFIKRAIHPAEQLHIEDFPKLFANSARFAHLFIFGPVYEFL